MISMLMKIVVIVGSLILGIGSVYVFKMPKDNPVEEIAEEVIKSQTGVDVDLTPSSTEKETPADKS